MVLLLHPPVTRACEPPPGIARLAGSLRQQGIPCRLYDGNLAGQGFLLGQADLPAKTPWDRRAVRQREGHLACLRSPAGYRNRDRYGRAVADLNRLLALAGRDRGIVPGLADYRDAFLSPLRSADLLRASQEPARNPFFPRFREDLSRLLEETTPALVGLSLNYLSQALCAFAMMGFLKEAAPRIPLVLGGGLATSWRRRPGWQNPFAGLVEEIVSGPGESRLLALLGKGGLSGAPARPAYDALLPGPYLSPGPILPYSAATGCWWARCAFCPERAEGNPYRPLPPRQAAEELEALVAAHQPVLVHLLDNALSPALLENLVARPPGVPWYGFVRLEKPLADPAFCRDLRRAGCALLQVGIESGSQKVLDFLDKGIDLAVASRALQSLAEAGIAPYVHLLFGTPAETEADARQTLAFTASHAAWIGFLHLALFNLPRGAPEARDLETAPFSAGDLSLYLDFVHPHGWDRAAIRRFLDREFSRNPAVAPILRRTPPLFTSNHAPFFLPPGG